MKLGYFTDLHARGDKPEARTDDFLKSLMVKLSEIGQIFKDQKVDYILFGGDLGNTPDISHGIINKLLLEFNTWKLPMISVIGSHDYRGYQIKSLNTTALGILVNAKIIELVGSEGYADYIDLEGVTICGTPHTYWLVDDVNNFYQPRHIVDNKLQIQIVHGDLLDKPGPPKWKHVTCDQVITESDLILSGHYHPGWEGAIYANKTVFVNPGSIGRLSRTKYIRTPKVCIIDTDKATEFGDKVFPFTLEFFELKSAIADPFSKKSIIQESEPVEDITQLMQAIEGTNLSAVDIKEQLPIVAKNANFSEEVVQECFNILDNLNGEIEDESETS